MDNWIDNAVVTQYKNGVSYQNSMNFTTKWPEYERFKAGDQWPAPTEKTKNLPRPVFNIIDYIEGHKVASIVNESLKMVFTSEEVSQDEENIQIGNAMDGADKFTKYSDTTWEEIDQDELNEDVLESASNVGTGIAHYYWDNNSKGGLSTKWIGNIKGEFIDPANCFFGNPQQKYVQKQPYIIITSRELVTSVQEVAKSNGVPEEYINQITADKETQNELYDAAQIEVDGTDKVTVITKYWKANGTIWFKKVVNNIVFQKDTDTKRKLYPIAIMVWRKRKKSIYGVGDTESLIPNQKGINLLLAMMLLSAQGTAWPKLLVKPGALKQMITNTPGEVITDYSQLPVGDGVKYMNVGQFSGQSLTLVNTFIDITKSFSGAQDAATGDINSSNMTATGIMLLQQAAGVPIKSIKKRYYRFMKDVGRIWEDFWKVNVNLTRSIKVKDENGNDVMAEFNGSSYKDIPFNLKIDIGPASDYSESLAQATLDKLYDKNAINTVQYLEHVPKNVAPFKERLLKQIQEQQMMQPPNLPGAVPGMQNGSPQVNMPMDNQLPNLPQAPQMM